MLENKLFEALLDVIPFGAYAVDVETYELVYANKIVRENLFAPQAEHCWEKIYGQDQICQWCSINKLQNKNINIDDEKYTCEFFDEIDDRWIKTYDELMSWPDGRKVKYSILVDTSDQKETQGAMIKSHATLAVKTKHINKTNKNLQITKLKLQKTVRELEEQKQKALDATKYKSEFVANMSHEIRTPISGILGMAHLANQTDDLEKKEQYIKQIEESGKILLSVINDVLDFSKIEAGKLDIESIDFSLKDLINNIKSITTENAIEKGLNYNINYEDQDYIGDPLRISQILLNFINNAIKFTSDGFVKVDIFETDDDKVRFCVEDSGIGMPQDIVQNLFQAFSQADSSITRRYGGTGLGLSISKQLVKMMGGEIYVESEEGKGTKFYFELKLGKTDRKNSNDQVSKIDTDDISKLVGRKILLVEDNSMNQKIILGLLEKSDIEIDIADNGKIALDMYNSNKNRYDLILMDLQMPVMDGYEASKSIRDIDNDIPIIALTANAMKEDIEKTKAAKMNEHLNKPIDIDRLYEVLLKYLLVA
jgi:signal transduction histidine kinase/BarA-like signal transduction histidine kinase